jgi:protein TonB
MTPSSRTLGAAAASVLLNGAAIALAVQGWGEAPSPAAAEEIVISTMLVRVRGSDLPAHPPAAAAVPSAPPRVPSPPLPETVAPVFLPKLPAEPPPTPPSEATAPTHPTMAAATSSAQPTAAASEQKGSRDGLEARARHGAGEDYASRLKVWLEAHKVYPKRSRVRREEGVVQLHFVVDRQGRLLGGDILRSSGHTALDAEALAMLDRSNPFPAAPHHVRGERIEISTPVAFSLDR